jgi:hypothetical protein
MTEIKPGIIICDANSQSYKAEIVPWGILLPKQQFLKYFEREKGRWPVNQTYTHDIIKQYGNFLPVNSRNNQTDNNVLGMQILPQEAFLSSENYLGVKWFGNVYSHLFKRELGFEIINSNSNTRLAYYPPNDLVKIVETREMKSEFDKRNTLDTYTPGIYANVTKDMHILQMYFNEKHPPNVIIGMYKDNKNLTKLVEALSECFPR